MLEWITNTINSLGYVGIALLMFLENLFPPIPSELIMPLAGFTARATPDRLNVFHVFIAGLIGSVLGLLIWYYPGKILGEERLYTLADKYGKWLGISRHEIVKATFWFNTKGRNAVLIGRILPGVRTLISVPAGLSNMPLLPFLIYSTIGSAIWVAFLTYAGYVLEYQLVERYLAPVSKIVLGILLVAFLVWVWRRKGGLSKR